MTGQNERIIAHWDPLSWQVQPWHSRAPVLLLTGSAGGGKSRIAAEKLHGYCQRYAGAMALMVRKTRNSMTNSTVLFMDRSIVGPDPRVRHYPSKNRFEYANGSVLAYGGMANEEQREQIRSIGQQGSLDIAWMEEATGFTEDDYNEIRARMRGNAASWRQIILTTNPSSDRHWIYQRLIKGKGAEVVYSKATDNLHNPADYAESLDGLTGLLRDRLRDGIWKSAEGAIYDEFDYVFHVQERPVSDFQRYLVGVDEGYTNPQVALVMGLDSDDRLHVCEELYQKQMLQADFVSWCKGLSGRYAEPAFYVDPSAAGLIAAMRAAGLRVKEANNAVTDGIQKVKARLKRQGDGRVRLTVDPSCTNTVSEFESYVWAQDRDKNATDKPVKANDHAMDALRYVAIDLAQRRTIRIMGV